MRTRVSTIEELKSLFVESLINKTDKVTKVSPNSVLNGIAYGIAKVSQKALKDVALVETTLFPDFAFGDTLDFVASFMGVSERFGASESSTYLRCVADEGTVYTAGVHTFSGTHGITFDLEETLTIGVHGFGYAKVRSQTQGLSANVEALTITEVAAVPTGHQYVINEFEAVGGRAEESDDLFRRRIKEGANLAAAGTLAKIDQVFMKINPNILKTYYSGIDTNGKISLVIATQNGIDLSSNELTDLENSGQEFLSLSDIRPVGSNSGNLAVTNVEYEPIDISMRVELEDGANADDVRRVIQADIARSIDFRFWEAGQKVEWDDLLEIAKNTDGVKYVPDTSFVPSQDVTIPVGRLPRVRGFLLLDINGVIISNISGTLNPIYYPEQADFSFQSTLLNSI